MQRIERYGVIALVFLLVTILAVSLWGEHRGQSVFSFIARGAKKSAGDATAAMRRRAGAGSDLALGERDPLRPVVPLNDAPQGATPLAPVDPARGFDQGPLDARPELDPENGFVAYSPLSSPAQAVVPAAPLGRSAPPPLSSSPIGPERVRAATSAPSEGAGNGKGAPSGVRTYVVQPRETLGEIAQRELGTYRRWTEIQSLNEGLDPAKLRAGMKLKLPSSAASVVLAKSDAGRQSGAARGTASKETSARRPSPGTSPAAPSSAASGPLYVVRSGDTLTLIAQRELGSADRWRELLASNPGLDPKRLLVGSRLRLPEARSARASEQRLAVAAAPSSGKKARVR